MKICRRPSDKTTTRILPEQNIGLVKNHYPLCKKSKPFIDSGHYTIIHTGACHTTSANDPDLTTETSRFQVSKLKSMAVNYCPKPMFTF